MSASALPRNHPPPPPPPPPPPQKKKFLLRIKKDSETPGEQFRAILASCLTFTTLWPNSADDKLMIFFLFFFQKTGFDMSCKLSPMKTGFDISYKLSLLETICMKSLILFSGKNDKVFQNVICWKVYPECWVWSGMLGKVSQESEIDL